MEPPQHQEPSTAAVVEDEEDATPIEMVAWQSPETYVYAPLPPTTSYGHRAELWGVERENAWFRKTRCSVVTAGEACFVRLLDQESGELFAECPLPHDGTSFTRAVEPCVDSSRFYVLRVVDSTDAKKHAAIGIGFRAREESMQFSAALDDHRQFLRRKREAHAMHMEYEARRAAEALEGAQGSGEPSAPCSSSLQLKPGQTLRLSSKFKKKKEGKADGPSPAATHAQAPQAADGLSAACAALKLHLPPPAPPPHAASQAGAPGSGTPTGSATAEEDDAWGEFVEAS